MIIWLKTQILVYNMDERVQARTVKILQRRDQYLARIKSIKRRVKNKVAKQKRQTKKISQSLKQH